MTPLANPDQPFPLQIGRDVQYVLPNGTVRPGKISHVWDLVAGVITCHVFLDPLGDPRVNEDEKFANPVQVARQTKYDAQNKTAGTWHWPNNTPPDIVPVGTSRFGASANGPQELATPGQRAQQTEKIALDPAMVDDGLQISGVINAIPAGVQCILSVQDEKMDYFLRGAYPFAFAYMPAPEAQFPGVQWLDAAVDMIRNWRKRGWVVLVHCTDGANRAAAVDVAYHMKVNGWRRDEALSVIRSKRPSTNPSPFYLAGLAEYDTLIQQAISQRGQGPQPARPQPMAASIPVPGLGYQQQDPRLTGQIFQPAPMVHDPRFAQRQQQPQFPPGVNPIQ